MSRHSYAWCGIAGLALLVVTTVMAHGPDGVHVMGVVKAADTASLSIETKDRKLLTIHFDEKTQFERSGSRATASDLQPGERVVVHAKRETNGLRAQLVRFGKSPKARPAGQETPDAGAPAKSGHSHGTR